ncbi:MAG TPA: hypothetical protein VMI32_18170 [Candidatus Solibacter sp.]|nr:hypothetical protein [Candidatus Solibacter sp.]
MSRIFDNGRFILAVTLAGLFGSIAAFGQSGRGIRGPNYDPKTETTINGVIQEVKEVQGPGRSAGTHLVVKTADAVYEVHVGPTWYLTQEKYAFTKDEQVEIVGSKVSYQGSDVILARQIKKDGNTWTLRDTEGFPLWSRGKSS